MKKSILLTSLSTIAACASVVAGATYALFTSESKVNVAVTSGTVSVVATAENFKVYSGQWNSSESKYDIVETRSDYFTNGGYVDYSDGHSIKISGMSALDYVTFDLKVENKSDIEIKYQTILSTVADTGLFDELDITLAVDGGTPFVYDGSTDLSDWTTLTPGTDLSTINVRLGLPEESNAQGLMTEIEYAVYAVQANAHTENPVVEANTSYVYTVKDLTKIRDEVNSGTSNYKGRTIKLMSDIDLENQEWTPIGLYGKEFYGSFDGNGYTVSNLKIDDLEVFGAGLFGYAINASFKNVNIHNVSIHADQEVGTICGSARTSTFDNIHVTGIVDLYADYAYAAGIVSQGYVDVSNCSVIPTGRGSIVVRQLTMAGGITAWLGEGGSSVINCHVENLDITAWTSVGSITGLLHYNNVMDNCSAENVVLTKTRNDGFPAIGAACGNWVAKANKADYSTKITNCSFDNIELNGSCAITESQSQFDFSSLYGAPYSASTSEAFKVTLDNTVATNITDNVKYQYSVSSTAELKAALNQGKDVILTKDIAMSESLTIRSGSINGNGYKITQSDTFNNPLALIYFENATSDVSVSNVVFDGIKNGAAIRTVNANIVIDNCTFMNAEHTATQGFVRLTLGNATIKNSKFINNKCQMVVSFGYDAANATDVLTIDNCTFENNTAYSVGVVYYADGAKCVLNNNKFINNTVDITSNGGTVYLGFTENNVITNNVFRDNLVKTTSTTTKRLAGALMIGYAATITGNAFVNNDVEGGHQDVTGNSVLASVYYSDIDLSGNYWGGNAPVNGEDYFIEYTNYSVIVNDYLDSYEF